MMKVELDQGSMQALAGSMVAYQGDVNFEYQGSKDVASWLKQKVTGEGLPLMRITGTGEVFLASMGGDVHIITLEDDALSVNGANILAYTDGLQSDVRFMRGAGMLGGGLFNPTLTGTGQVAIATDGNPVVLEPAQAPTFVDPDAAVCWSANLQPQLQTAIGMKALIGRSSGEKIQLGFEGAGSVVARVHTSQLTDKIGGRRLAVMTEDGAVGRASTDRSNRDRMGRRMRETHGAIGMRRGVRVGVLLALVAAVSAAPMVSAEAITRPTTRYAEHAVTTGVVVPGFPIDHVGVVFDLPAGEDVTHEHDGDAHAGTDGLAVRFHTAGSWGPWKPMIEDGAQQVGRWTGALVAADDADAYQVRGVPAFARDARAAALDTTDGPLQVVGHRPAGSADAATTCRSRADWGADETIRTAARSYAPVQIMTVHHTATQNDDPDPDARVRAIYEYHVTTNGWDDIGYQALISEDGTVYEGRWSGSDSASCMSGAGGTGWDFGHDGTADDAGMVTGAHTGGYNTGNYGIALLGTLSDVGPEAGARDALVEYLAELAHRHGIDPESQVAYDNGVNAATVNAVNGHRDFTATVCPGGELYDDLPVIRAEVGAAIAGGGPEVTIASPSEAGTYTAQESASGDGVTLTFSAGAVTDSSGVTWRWTDVDGETVATTSSFEAVLDVGTHTYTATATDAEGATGSDVIEVTVLEAEATATTYDDTASGETAVAGTVSGTYVDTTADDGMAQTITEIESGGRPSLRHSHLEHVWTLDVTGGTTVTLFVDAAGSTSSDGDDFVFEYAADGESFAPVLVVPAGGDGRYSGSLPATASGTVHIRVRDTDRAQGAGELDRIVVDHLFVRSESGSAPVPSAPGSLSATATTASTVDLAWDDVADEWGYELERGTDTDGDGTADRWDPIAETGADITAVEASSLDPSTTYGFRVRSHNGGGASTWTSTTATTEAVSGISLTASGHKVKGKQHVELTWSGATSVRVYRDGAPVTAVSGTSYTDATGGTGRGEYTHQVCAIDEAGAETGTCSNAVTTTFS